MNTHYDSDIILDYVHGALEPVADAAVFAHLEACDACRLLRDEEAALGDALRAMARTTELEFPSMVKARVWDAVRRERPSLLDRLRSGWGPAIAVPIAAGIALAAYLGAPVLRNHDAAPTVAAGYYFDEHNAQAMQNPLGPSVTPAVYTSSPSSSSAASYIDTADAATLNSADGAPR